MSENRSHAQSKRPTTPREFFLPVEVYISNQAAAALRKPNPRKKAEKREKAGQKKVVDVVMTDHTASAPPLLDRLSQSTKTDKYYNYWNQL